MQQQCCDYIEAEIKALQEPPILGHSRSILQQLRRNVLGLQLPPLLNIPPLIIRNHPRAQHQRQDTPQPAKGRRRRERRDILGCVLVAEDIAAHDAHEVRDGDADGGEHDAAVLVGDVVVVPHVEDDGGGGRAPRHHEAGEVGDMDLGGDVDGDVDDEADEGQEEA